MSRDVCSMSCNVPFLRNHLPSIMEAEKKLKKFKMNFESKRLESYYNWPIPWFNTKDMAKNGFYYTDRGDRVKFNFCELGLADWEAKDDPLAEHKRWSPSCVILTGNNNVNQPLEKPIEKTVPLEELVRHTISNDKKFHFICCEHYDVND